MRVLALTPSRPGVSPGQRSSIELWEGILAGDGVSLEYAPFETEALARALPQRGRFALKLRELSRSYARRLRLMSRLPEFDAVLVYREAALIGPAFIERLVARSGKPLIYQLDDPLYVPYKSPSNGWFSYLKCFGKVKTICRLSRVAIVNSSHHRDFALRHAREVRLIPSLVDGEVFKRTGGDPTAGRSTVCIGWSGSSSSAGNLSLIREALARLREQCQFRLHLIGATGTEFRDTGATHQTWQNATEVEDLSQLDVGLVPLLDTPWNRRKFFMKVVQYMALGIVPVATPLGSNPEVIEHGRTGFLAASQSEWVRYLEALISDPSLRARMARDAARVAHAKFTLQANAAAIRAAFRAVLET